MQLKSTFSDYYDWFFHSLTSNECGTYFRNPNLGKKTQPPKGEMLHQSIEYPKELKTVSNHIMDSIYDYSLITSFDRYDKKGNGFSIQPGFVVVGEFITKMYSLTSTVVDKKGKVFTDTDYFYCIDDLKTNLFEKHNYDFTPNKYSNFSSRNIISKFEKMDILPVVDMVRETFDQPILIFKHNKLNVDHSLSDVQFQKIMPPEQVYQEVAMWEHNKLAEKSSVEFDDKTKIKSHGFDVKKSFRHR